MNRHEITVYRVQGDELAEQWAGERDPQPVYAALYLRSGALSFEVSGTNSGDSATSADVYYGIERRYSIGTALDAEHANALLDELEPLAQRVLDGAEIATDPAGNTAAVLDDDAVEADAEIEALLGGYSENSGGAITAATCASLDIDWDTDGVTAWTPSHVLDRIAEEITDAVRESGTVLMDALDSVTRYRDGLLAEHEAAVAEARDDHDDDALTDLLLDELRGRDPEWTRKTQEEQVDSLSEIEAVIERYSDRVATVDGETTWYAVIAGEVYRVDNHDFGRGFVWEADWLHGDDLADLGPDYRAELGLTTPAA